MASTIELENAEFMYRPNFEGRKEMYNEDGDRQFNVKIPDSEVERLKADGWNVKVTKLSDNHPNPEEFVPQFYLPVELKFGYRPPTIYMIYGDRPTLITEETAKQVDNADIESMDMAIRPYEYDSAITGKGVKAYLQELYIKVRVTKFTDKYLDIIHPPVTSAGPVDPND